MLTKLLATVKTYAIPFTLAALIAVVALAGAPATTHAASPAVAVIASTTAVVGDTAISPLSLDMTTLFTNAWMLIENLWPVMSLSAGFTLN